MATRESTAVKQRQATLDERVQAARRREHSQQQRYGELLDLRNALVAGEVVPKSTTLKLATSSMTATTTTTTTTTTAVAAAAAAVQQHNASDNVAGKASATSNNGSGSSKSNAIDIDNDDDNAVNMSALEDIEVWANIEFNQQILINCSPQLFVVVVSLI